MLERLYKTWHFWLSVFLRFDKDGCFYRSSALTFTSLLALVPLMVVVLSVLSAFPVFDALSKDLQDFIFANFVPSTGEVVKTYLMSFVSQARNLSMVGVMFLIVTSILLLFTIEQAFNSIWRVQRRRRLLGTFMLYWAILTLSPFLIGLSIGASTYIMSSPIVTEFVSYYGLAHTISVIVTILLASLFFSILYITVPNCNVPISAGLWAGIFAAVLFELAKFGFAIYLMHFPTYQIIYGALATIPVFLIWVYLIWLITLLGAEMCHLLAFRYGYGDRSKLSGFYHAFRWIGHLWHAGKQGKNLSLLDLVELDHCQYEITPQTQIRTLRQAGLVQKNQQEYYFLSCDLSSMTLAEFYKQLPWKLPSTLPRCGSNVHESVLTEVITATNNDLDTKLAVTLGGLLNSNNDSDN